MHISIIIPTFNETSTIGRLIERLLTANRDKIEVIVVDGGSEDDTVAQAEALGAKVIYCDCSRAKQMNEGARIAQNEILYFVHSDTLPPVGYDKDGIKALQNGYDAACYKSRFEHKPPLMHLNEFFSQFYWLVSRGGDQSLFIYKDVFNALGMYDEQMVIMEEYPLIEKLMQTKKLCIIQKSILISTRKYTERSWLKVNRANYIAFKLYKRGEDSRKIKTKYLELLGECKNP